MTGDTQAPASAADAARRRLAVLEQRRVLVGPRARRARRRAALIRSLLRV